MLSIILNAKSSDDDVPKFCRCCLPIPGLVRCLLALLLRLFIDPLNGVIEAVADTATANAADLPRADARAEADDDELLLSPSRDEDDVAAAF